MNPDISNSPITGRLGYLVPSTLRPCNYMFQPPAGVPWENCKYEQHECSIHDARRIASTISLESNGFELLDTPSIVGEFDDDSLIKKIYYCELEELALNITGGSRAVVFDHLYRRRDEARPTTSFGRDGDGTPPSAVGRVHNDYTEKSAWRRHNIVLSDAPSDSPFLILNFWRPVHHPLVDTPLAVCDTRSFPTRDWVEGDLIYPDRTGEIYLARYSEAHRWYFYPSMTPSEMLVFKTYDSRLDVPARMTAHCAFDDETAPIDSPPRRSIEARCLVILD